MTDIPKWVQEALARSKELGFELSCEEFVGRLLSVLSANVRPDGRILELGTGAGVGLSWIVSGLAERKDVKVVTVDTDAELLNEVQKSNWPAFVEFKQEDGAREVTRLGKFDLIFADAPGGKLTNIEGTISALNVNGLLVVDDMDLTQHEDDEPLRNQLRGIIKKILSDERLLCVELPISSGVILAVRQ